MPRIIRSILRNANNIYALANNSTGVKVDRQEFLPNNRTYCEHVTNNNGRFGGLTKNVLYTANISLSSGTVANVENVIPAGTMVFGITGLVTTAITGPSGFQIGHNSRDTYTAGLVTSTNANSAANNVSSAVGTNTNMTTANAQISFPILFRFNSNVMISSNSTTAFTGGAVRVAVHGVRFDPPNA